MRHIYIMAEARERESRKFSRNGGKPGHRRPERGAGIYTGVLEKSHTIESPIDSQK